MCGECIPTVVANYAQRMLDFSIEELLGTGSNRERSMRRFILVEFPHILQMQGGEPTRCSMWKIF